MKHLQEVKMEDMGMAQEDIDKAMSRGASWQTPQMFLMWGILGSLLISAIFGLIMAAILKKPNPEEIV